jgi:hypothetical protein
VRLARLRGGGLAERSKAHAWKACRGATPSRVRTPQPPPQNRVTHLRVRPGGRPLVRAGPSQPGHGHVADQLQAVPRVSISDGNMGAVNISASRSCGRPASEAATSSVTERGNRLVERVLTAAFTRDRGWKE